MLHLSEVTKLSTRHSDDRVIAKQEVLKQVSSLEDQHSVARRAAENFHASDHAWDLSTVGSTKSYAFVLQQERVIRQLRDA